MNYPNAPIQPEQVTACGTQYVRKDLADRKYRELEDVVREFCTAIANSPRPPSPLEWARMQGVASTLVRK